MKFVFDGTMEEFRELFSLQSAVRSPQEKKVGTTGAPKENPKSGGRAPNGEAKKDDLGGKPYSGGKVPKTTLQDIKMRVDLKGLNASDAISAIIAETNITKSALATLLGVNPQSIYNIGQGLNSPSVEQMMSERLGWVDPDQASPLTLQDIKDEVPINECESIQELIEAIIELCGITQGKLAGLLGVHPADLSKVKNGQNFPFVDKAFRQHLGWEGGPGYE